MDKLPTLQDLPTPTKFVELSFDYANKFLEMRKQYALQVAEMFTEATSNVMKAAHELVRFTSTEREVEKAHMHM